LTRFVLLWLAIATALAFSGRRARSFQGEPGARPAVVEARAYHYQDSSGLLVGTYAAGLRQPLPGGLVVDAHALADYVRIDGRTAFDPTRPGADRSAPDAVTSASATAGGGAVAEEWRFEGLVGLGIERVARGLPVSAGATVRASTEPDYRSFAGALRAGAELFERNTSVSLAVGYGSDRVEPVEVLGGQEALWPASHQRWTVSAAGSQILTRRLVLAAGATVTFQRGRLSSPYRRALVRPTLLLPEVLPEGRDRATGFVGLSWAVGARAALHLRPGWYLDDWGVKAFIPEAALAAEIEDGVLLTASYRLYWQGAASFYQATYPDVAPVMSGDLRLGPIHEQVGGLELRWRLGRGGGLAEFPLLVGYQLSALDYRAVGARVVAHVFMLGLEVRR
jgi:hypothetical protein